MVDYKTEYEKINQKINDAYFEIETNQNLINLKKNTVINQYIQKINQQEQAGQITSQQADALKKETTDTLTNAFETYTALRIPLIKNPDSSPENINEINFLLTQVCPELEQIDTYIEEIAMAEVDIELFQEQLTNLQTINEEVEPDACQQLDNLQTIIDQEIQNNIDTNVPDYEGHVYPIALVVSWTKQLKNINEQIDNYIKNLEEVDLEVVDKTWLRKNIQNFVDWISQKLSAVRQKIVKSMKAIFTDCNKLLTEIKKILPTSISLDSIISWATNVIAFFTKPYETVVLFIKDFGTYTPPLVSEATKLAANTVKTPQAVLSVLGKLTTEEGKEIQEEANRELQKITFDPISLGDLQ